MSSTTITIMRCDRCGHSTDPGAATSDLSEIISKGMPPHAPGWGKVAAAETGVLDRKRTIGGVGREGDDLCPGCVEALFAWWQSPGDVVQPAPPPAAPPRVRPRFTIDDRNELTTVLRVGFREQVIVACAAYRAEPTAAIAPGDLEEAFEGVDDRAITLARKIVEQLEARD